MTSGKQQLYQRTKKPAGWRAEADIAIQFIVSLAVLVGIVALIYYGVAGAVAKGVRDSKVTPPEPPRPPEE